MREPKLSPSPGLVQLIAEIDEFKGRWEALKTLAPDRLTLPLKSVSHSGVHQLACLD